MVKDRVPKSTKSNRPVGHDRFKDLYANHTATTPELANRAPRQVAQSVTPTTTGGTTTGNECTPVTKTPIKPQNRPKKKKAKWSHVPSASDGDATHAESFENDGGAQLAVAKIKTRELQWKSKEQTVEAAGSVEADETDAGESFRQKVDGGVCGSDGSVGSAGSDDARLPPLELTQEDQDRTEVKRGDATHDETDKCEGRNEPTVKKTALPLLSPQPSKEIIEKVQPTQHLQPMKEKSPQKNIPPSTQKETSKPTVRSPQKQPQSATKVQQRQSEMTKQEQRRSAQQHHQTPLKKSNRGSSQEVKKRAQVPRPMPTSCSTANSTTEGDEPPPVTNKKSQSVGRKEEPTSANYRTAVKLMKILKRNNYLENALRYEDTEKVRKHFESAGFGQAPPPQILTLLNRALDFALETVLFRADDLDTSITNELRVFIIKKQEARQSMLEVILNRPWLLPNKWGGARVSAKRSKTSKSREGGKLGGWFSSFFR